MPKVYCVLASLLILAPKIVINSNRMMGPIGEVKITAIESFEEDLKNDYVFINITLQGADRKLFANVTTKIFFDNSLSYDVTVSKWTDAGFRPHMHHKDNFCKTVLTFAPKFWEKFRAAMKPSILEECSIKPGFYSIDEFETSMSDFDISAIYYGRFLIQIRFVKNDEVIINLDIEAVSRPPN